ncbi:MAG: RNA polymerase factor sigma-54, partial [Vicinamibacteria bacterium]
MALEQKLSVRMSQRLIMTPSLQQAIKLLQMSKLELVEEIQQELLENPVLEDVPEEAPALPEPQETEPAPAAGDADERKDPFEDIDYESYFHDVEGSYVPRAPIETGEALPSFENTLAKPTNLADHLVWQLDLSTSSPLRKEVGRAIIGNLNEDGYLVATLEEIRQMGGFPLDEVRATLAM